MDPRTSVISNGLSNVAQFAFEAFRFVEHRDQAKSSIYLHCILRLCEPTKCQEVLKVSWQINQQQNDLGDGKISWPNSRIFSVFSPAQLEEKGLWCPLENKAVNLPLFQLDLFTQLKKVRPIHKMHFVYSRFSDNTYTMHHLIFFLFPPVTVTPDEAPNSE